MKVPDEGHPNGKLNTLGELYCREVPESVSAQREIKSAQGRSSATVDKGNSISNRIIYGYSSCSDQETDHRTRVS